MKQLTYMPFGDVCEQIKNSNSFETVEQTFECEQLNQCLLEDTYEDQIDSDHLIAEDYVFYDGSELDEEALMLIYDEQMSLK